MHSVIKTLFTCTFLLALGVASVYAQEMTMKEYNAQIQEWVNRETAAKDEIAKSDADIESLKSQIADADNQIAGVWNDIYAAIGVTEADVNAYRQELNDFERQLNALGALSPEELFKRRKELDELDAKILEKKQSRIYALTEMRNQVAGLEGKTAQLRAKMPKGMYDEYTVIRGDYLWKISRNQYGEGIQWMRIYSYNREQINDPDMIFPEQIFKIHRENSPTEYLVSPGDNLAKIAGSMDMMSDPTKWRELYEANKGIIGDEPSLIYPHQVLKIPK
ncbi:MAG: LysM peptidoglycan-binding domain-containing protein [bacterium]